MNKDQDSVEITKEMSKTLDTVTKFKSDIDGRLDNVTKAQQETNSNVETMTKKYEEATTRIKDMEVEILENKSYSTNSNKLLKNKDVVAFTKALTMNSPNEARKSFEGGNVTFDNSAGGYLVPEVLANKILEPVFNEGSDALIRLPNTMVVKAKDIKIIVQDTLPVPYRRNECQEAGYSNASFSKLELSPNSLSCIIRQSWEFMNYQNEYTPQKMASDLQTSYTATIANEILNGDGNGRYLGVLKANQVNSITSRTANNIDLRDIQNMLASLKFGYQPTLVMHRSTWWYLQQQIDTMGRFLLNPNAAVGTPLSLFGYPVVVVGDIFVADPSKTQTKNGKIYNAGSFKPLIDTCDLSSPTPFASNSTPIIIGDFKVGYTQVIAQTLFVQPDPYTEGGSACMKWYFHMYNDGMPTMPEAFIKLKIK